METPETALIDSLAAHIAAKYPAHSILRLNASNSQSLVGVYLDPVEYAEKVLKVTLTKIQKVILSKLNEPPYKVLVRSGHNVGKSYISAVAVNWWYDTFSPSMVLTTAPTERQVKQILWKEVRLQRARVGLKGFTGPKDAYMGDDPGHFAQGFTARDGSSFQGLHSSYVLIVFDEAQGVDAEFWTAAQPMLDGIKYGFLGIYNPVGQGTRVFVEENNIAKEVSAGEEAPYHPVIQMSCLDHPNIQAELQGQPPVIPNAIRLKRLKQLLQQWADKIPKEQSTPTDIELDGQWWRPGPIADARIVGRWPLRSVNTVWSKSLFDACKVRRLSDVGPLQIGCDVARYGDDFTAIHVRKGGVSLHHERHNGWDTVQIAKRIIELCVEYSLKYRGERINEKKIVCAIDDSGVGGGVVDYGRSEGFQFVGVNSSWTVESLEDEFPNLRSALWFSAADLAKQEKISLARLQPNMVAELEGQLCSQKYELDTRSRRMVWSKDKMKDEDGEHSPDDADGFNLAFLNVGPVESRVTGRIMVSQ